MAAGEAACSEPQSKTSITASILRSKRSTDKSFGNTISMSLAQFSSASIWSMAFSSGPRSPDANRERMRFTAVSKAQTIRNAVTPAPEHLAISRNRLRCSSDRNDPTATTNLFAERASATAAPIAAYACTIASLLRSPEAVRAAAPNSSANVSDAKPIAPQRSTARCAKVDFPAPGTPQTMIKRDVFMTFSPKAAPLRSFGS